MKHVSYPPLYVQAEMPSLFLAGSIEMGKAIDWQQEVIDALRTDRTIFNPRRADWDASWKQDINNPQFYEQVTWELDHLSTASVVLFRFVAGTMSPISLLELGLVAASPRLARIIVWCDEGFWRKGNIDIVCERYDIKQVSTLEGALAAINLGPL